MEERKPERPGRIEDYALIGDLHTAGLVGRNGSIDWLCLPHFDSPACFAALLGNDDNGRWRIAPQGEVKRMKRAYRPNTLILETEFETGEGRVALIDFMPSGGDTNRRSEVIRIVEGREGTVRMHTEIVFRFDYGEVVPWVRHADDGIHAVAGPVAVHLRTAVPLKGENFRTEGVFTVRAGERVNFVSTCSPSHLHEPPPTDAEARLKETETWWRDWAGQCPYDGPWREQVVRSLITLKALTFNPTGGIVAAPTTSLPERPGGARNWDYRFCWLRDATFTLYAFLLNGYRDEARDWRAWLLRAAAGTPAQLQPLYGLAGERRAVEYELPWLRGYKESRPVRVGNGAVGQFQLDIYGEVMDTFHNARAHGIESDDHTWPLQKVLVDFLQSNWERPDAGIWEMRGPERHFTHSKVMAWVALDRAVKAVERFRLDGPAARWKVLRQRIHDDICRRGYDPARGTFTQYFGGKTLDASLLLLPLVGFLSPHDPRMKATVEAIGRDLCHEGLIRRYDTDRTEDGLAGGEGVFLACSFWMADNLALLGRREEAREMFERLLGLANDVGLLGEEYDPVGKRMLGNFPQAFSHIALVNTAHNLWQRRGPSEQRAASGH
jgi:GH15 family glucan-1,4-alpha-glucosidase